MDPQEKARIDRDYQLHAMNYGHKTYLIQKLQKELDEHFKWMKQLNDELVTSETLARVQKPEGPVSEVTI